MPSVSSNWCWLFRKHISSTFQKKKCFYLQKISQRYRCLLLLTSRLSFLFSLPYIYRRRDYRGFLIKNGKYECYSLSLPRNEFLWMAKWLVVPCWFSVQNYVAVYASELLFRLSCDSNISLWKEQPNLPAPLFNPFPIYLF